MDGKNGIEEMRVQDSVICAKMTEERSKNGVSEIASGKTKIMGEGGSGTANGALSPTITQSSDSDITRTPGGGRLKFFKDGKLIFELSHRKEGERTAWIPVPKKTFWPPSGGGGASMPAMAIAGTSRQEGSTSLSVSDDNSSVQSSPWQRDHCWKQQTPRRDVGKELTFFMQPRPRVRWIRRKAANVVCKKRRRPMDTVEITWDDSDKLANLPFKASKVKFAKGKLLSIIDRLVSSAVEVTHNKPPVPSCSKMDPSLVSPRKRILREFERVSLEDQASKRHKRPSAFLKSPSPPSVAGCSSSSHHVITAVKTKGNFNVPSSTPSPPACYAQPVSAKTKVEKLGSYSINSLLGKSDSDPVVSNEPSFLRSLLKSPSRTTGGSDLVCVGGSSSPSSVIHSPQSPPEARWSKPHKKKLPPSPDTQCASLRLSSAPPSHHTTTAPSHHLSPSHFLSPPPPHMYHSLSFLPPPQPPLMSAHFYSPYPPRTPLWSHPSTAASLHYAGLMPLPQWTHPPLGPPTPPQQPLLLDSGKREELADMPLNLSKHAG